MKTDFEMFQSVIAARNIFEPELMGAWGKGKPGKIDGKLCVLEGTHGAVVEIFEKADGLAVEFFDGDGNTIDVAFIPSSFVRPATPEEIYKRLQRTAVLHTEQ